MYRIIQRASEYADYPKAFATLVIGFLLAIAVFNLVIVPFHNYVKYYLIRKFGDYSAMHDGLCTMRPRPNIHIVGLFTSLVLNVGFAAPAYIDTDHFRKPKTYTCIVSLAGVLTYVACFVVSFFIYASLNVNDVFDVSVVTLHRNDCSLFQYIYNTFFVMIYFIAQTCLYSAIFNLIPAFPLDMGDALYVFMPVNWQDNLRNNDLAISLALFVFAFLYLCPATGIIPKMGVPIMENYMNLIGAMFGK